MPRTRARPSSAIAPQVDVQITSFTGKALTLTFGKLTRAYHRQTQQ